MTLWDSQLFQEQAPGSIDSAVIQAAIASAQALADERLAPLFTLNHLAHNADVPYPFLRDVVERAPVANPYRVFKLHKAGVGGPRRFRWIAAPNPLLLRAQQWINREILAHLMPHSACYAYRRGRSAYDAASLHARARWLVKVDVKNFFESILEPKVYSVFRTAGYQPLIAFELARICTRLRTIDATEQRDRFIGSERLEKYSIEPYRSNCFGHLPQGAATSPALANLIVKPLDIELAALASERGFRYSRYADDIAFSSASKECNFSDAKHIEQKIYEFLRRHGFRPNMAKSQIRGPGARKLVLGLLVDGAQPRLTKEFRGSLNLHIKHLVANGPISHAQARGFQSVIGLRHYIEGLLSYAHRIDEAFVDDCRSQLQSVKWPLFEEVDLTELETW